MVYEFCIRCQENSAQRSEKGARMVQGDEYKRKG